MPDPIRRLALHLGVLLAACAFAGCQRGTNAPEQPTSSGERSETQGVSPGGPTAPAAPEIAGAVDSGEQPAAAAQTGEADTGDSVTPSASDQPPAMAGELEEEPPAPIPPAPVEEWPFFKEIASQGGTVTLLDRATGNVWLAVTPKSRAVAVLAKVVLRRGILEHLLCLTGTKEHEAILAATLTPEVLHAALIAAGAEPGSPVRYDPEYGPPTGTRIEIELEWWDGKEWRRESAKNWLVEDRTGKPFRMEWVFAGSKTVKHPTTGEEYYLGREGDLVTVANMVSAVIDVAGFSSASNEALLYRTRDEAVPPLDTPVLVILRPVTEKTASERTTPEAVDLERSP